jgi:hypothetical protein
MRNLRLLLGLALVLAMALFGSGCGHNVYFSDDEGGPRASGGLGDHPDELSLPYALGTTVGIAVRNINGGNGWQVVSDTPDVFAIEKQMLRDDGTLAVVGHGLAEGEARLRAIDAGGHERRSAQVRVRAADRARLFAHGDLRVLGNDSSANYDSAEVTEARVLTGATAVLAVGYYHGTERVYGRGLAEAATAPLVVEDHTSSGAPTNEWLFVRAGTPGSYTLAVAHAGTTLATVNVVAVADSEVTGLSLAEESTAEKHDGDQTWLLARARTTDGHEVLGVYCDWTLDGAAQAGPSGGPTDARGDLYRYRYAPGSATRAVVATHGGLTATAMVKAHDGTVNNTTYLGCAAAPGAPSSGGAGVIALLGAIAWVLGRRRGGGGATSISA